MTEAVISHVEEAWKPQKFRIWRSRDAANIGRRTRPPPRLSRRARRHPPGRGGSGRAIVARLSTFLTPIDLAVPIDWRILLFTASTMVATALLFGTLPAWRAARVEPAAAVQAAARQSSLAASGGRRSAGLLGFLIVGQIAMSLTLVVTAVLLVRSFERLAASDARRAQFRLNR